MFRGVRGAITIKENTEAEIVSAAEKLVRQIIEENQLSPEAAASVIFSVTEDITAAFPAKAVRRIDGWKYVPTMCMTEIPVPNSLKMCIRVMMHINTNKAQDEINHVYLNGAVILRPDLQTKNI